MDLHVGAIGNVQELLPGFREKCNFQMPNRCARVGLENELPHEEFVILEDLGAQVLAVADIDQPIAGGTLQCTGLSNCGESGLCIGRGSSLGVWSYAPYMRMNWSVSTLAQFMEIS